ncbi:MAG: thioredoxin family protein [archaeon]
MTQKIIILTILLAIVTLSLTACDPKPPVPDPNNDTNYIFGDYTIKEEKTLPILECTARKLKDKVLVIHAEHCGACKIAVPILEELEQEMNLEFRYYDMDVDEDKLALKEFKLVPYFTPTVVIGCEVLIGAKDKDEYQDALEEFLGNQ